MKLISICLFLCALAHGKTITNGTVTATLGGNGELSASAGGVTFFTAPFALGAAAFEVAELPATSHVQMLDATALLQPIAG